jgi:predicted nucleotidyltransferase
LGEEVNMKDEKLRGFYDEETRKVVEILKKADPEKIIRFGSSVWGTLSEDSDIDFCISKIARSERNSDCGACSHDMDTLTQWTLSCTSTPRRSMRSG